MQPIPSFLFSTEDKERDESSDIIAVLTEKLQLKKSPTLQSYGDGALFMRLSGNVGALQADSSVHNKQR